MGSDPSLIWDACRHLRPYSGTPVVTSGLIVWDACHHLRPYSGTPVVTSGLTLGRLSSPPAFLWDACRHLRPSSGTPVVTSGLPLGRLSSPPALLWDACRHLLPYSGTPVITHHSCSADCLAQFSRTNMYKRGIKHNFHLSWNLYYGIISLFIRTLPQ